MKHLLFSILLLLPLVAHAYDAEIIGVYYDFDQSTKSATVTNETSVYTSRSYSIVEDVPVPEVEDFENLLENAGFEEWNGDVPVAWKSTTTASNATLTKSTDAHSGSYSVCVNSKEGSNVRLGSKELVLKPGNYTFSFWVKSESGENASARPGYGPWDEARDAMGSYVYNENINDITDWQEITYDFELKTLTQVNLVVMNPKGVNVNLLIDDASLTTSDGDIYMAGTSGEVGPLPQTEMNINLNYS